MGLAVTKQEAFWEACGFGHVKRVKTFIEQGIDVNWVSYTHNSCAIHVASQGKPEIVQMLIDAKCKINVKDDRGNLALHHAAMKGHADIMQMLIDAGSEIDTQDKNGWSPLISAAYFCQPAAIELLVSNNCDVHLQNQDERTALHQACRSQSTDENGLAIIACHLVEAGSDINAKSSDVGEADFTPLMFASYHGHAEMADILAEAGCDINSQGSNGWTALHWAADRGHMKVVEVLLHWNLDPLLEGRRGELAVDRAQDIEIKNKLQEATSRAKQDRAADEEFVCHSPVSTTSPMSSRSSSMASIPRDDEEELEKLEDTQRSDVTGDEDKICDKLGDLDDKNELEKAVERLVGEEMSELNLESTESSKDKPELFLSDDQEIEKSVDSSKVESAISAPVTDTCNACLESNVAAAEKKPATSSCCDLPESADVTNTDEIAVVALTSDLVCSELDTLKSDDLASGSLANLENKSNEPDQMQLETSEASNSGPPTSPPGARSSADQSESSASTDNSLTTDSNPTTPVKQNPQIQRLLAQSAASDTDDGNLSDNLFNDADYSADLGDVQSDVDSSLGSPAKQNPQVQRLLAPSAGSGASDTDDGNLSDNLFKEDDYAVGLIDSDAD